VGRFAGAESSVLALQLLLFLIEKSGNALRYTLLALFVA
jgi:hypothetical protein